MLTKKAENTVNIGMATPNNIINDVKYQTLNLFKIAFYTFQSIFSKNNLYTCKILYTLIYYILYIEKLIRAHNDLGRVNYLRKKDYEPNY